MTDARKFPGQVEQSILDGRRIVAQLLSAEKYPFLDLTPSKLPLIPGVYAISTMDGQLIRAGRTEKQSLQDRIYRNHLMGNQKGNLRNQLVKDGVCKDLDEAKTWIRGNCQVQLLTLHELHQLGVDIRWAEHFILAVLRPKYSN